MSRPAPIPTLARRLCLAALAAVAGGCAVGPDFTPPAPALPAAYQAAALPAPMAADGQVQRLQPSDALPADWWHLFGSAPLDAAVDRALRGNPSLQAAEATLRQSQDAVRAGAGVFYPQLDAGAAGGRERTAPSQEGSTVPGTVFNLATVSGTLGYTLDLFGGERRAVEALGAEADYQRNVRQATWLTLSADVVETAIASAAYADEVALTERELALLREQLDLIRAQVDAGTASYASVLSQQSLIAGTEAVLPALRQKQAQSDHLLATLQGAFPGAGERPALHLGDLRTPQDLPLSVPSALLRHRPDILQAEAQLHAASAQIGVATAAMFPSLSLDASYGLAGKGLGGLSHAAERFWSVGPSLSVPLFRGGSLWFGRQAAIDAYHAQEGAYKQVVLNAFAQVCDQLDALDNDARVLQAQVRARDAAGAALSLTEANFKAGIAAYADLLAADIQFQQARIGYLQATAQRDQDTVALFVAMGGGWWNAAREQP